MYVVIGQKHRETFFYLKFYQYFTSIWTYHLLEPYCNRRVKKKFQFQNIIARLIAKMLIQLTAKFKYGITNKERAFEL